MKPSNAIATSVGILVWAWTFITFTYLEPRVSTWITFLTWASFYAAGGEVTGLTRSIASGIVGALASAAVMWIDSQLGSGAYHLLTLSLLLGVLGWFLCMVSAIRLLSGIPAGFIGAAAFFGAGAPTDVGLIGVLTSIIIGAFLGFASQKLAEALTKATPASIPSQKSRKEKVSAQVGEN